jgi:uncharacterized phosphatase
MFLRKDFFFIRHGQTDYNLGIPTEGPSDDLSLNQTGKAQAQSIEPIIAALPISTICHSPLKRAKQTKEIISGRLSVRSVEIPELSECSPAIWREMTALGLQAYILAEGTVRAFMDQVKTGINRALAEKGPVLIVAHGGVHWAMSCLMSVEHEWSIDHCIPVHFTIQGAFWTAQKL